MDQRRFARVTPERPFHLLKCCGSRSPESKTRRARPEGRCAGGGRVGASPSRGGGIGGDIAQVTKNPPSGGSHHPPPRHLARQESLAFKADNGRLHSRGYDNHPARRMQYVLVLLTWLIVTAAELSSAFGCFPHRRSWSAVLTSTIGRKGLIVTSNEVAARAHAPLCRPVEVSCVKL